jgi:hypothetical protein
MWLKYCQNSIIPKTINSQFFKYVPNSFKKFTIDETYMLTLSMCEFMNLPARRFGGTAVRPWSERSLIFSPDWVLEGDFTLTFFFPADRPLEDVEEVPRRFGEGLLLFLLPGLMEPLFLELDLDLAEPFLVGEGDLDFAD